MSHEDEMDTVVAEPWSDESVDGDAVDENADVPVRSSRTVAAFALLAEQRGQSLFSAR